MQKESAKDYSQSDLVMTSCLRPDLTTTSLEQNFNSIALDELV